MPLKGCQRALTALFGGRALGTATSIRAVQRVDVGVSWPGTGAMETRRVNQQASPKCTHLRHFKQLGAFDSHMFAVSPLGLGSAKQERCV